MVEYQSDKKMTILEEVRTIVAQILELDVEDLPVDTEMEEIGEWDSIHNVMILAKLEEHYDILFPEDDVFDLVSVKALANEVEKLKNRG